MFPLALSLLLSQPVPAAVAPDETDIADLAGAPTGAVALWGETVTRLSLDGGKTFARVLVDAETSAGAEVDQGAGAFDDDGTLYRAQHNRLGVRAPNGAEHWFTIPGATTSQALAVRRGRIVWLGSTDGGASVYSVSLDGGRTFSARYEWGVGNYIAEVALDAQGRVHLIGASTAGCGGYSSWRERGPIAAATLAELGTAYEGAIGVGATGWLYTLDTCNGEDGARGICIEAPWKGAARRAPIAIGKDVTTLVGASDGTKTWMLVGGQLLVADGPKVRVVADGGPAEPRRIAVAGTRVRQVWVQGNFGVAVFEDHAWHAVGPDGARKPFVDVRP